jgi:hypothetical protein
MKNYNYIIGPTDTDSISFCKSDMAPFGEEEFKNLLKEINDLSPEFIEWEDDGLYSKCLVLKAKNYILIDMKGNKTIKGSAFKDSKKPKCLTEYMAELTELLLNEAPNEDLLNLYNDYTLRIMNVKDIAPWSKKLTITDKIMKCKGHENMEPQEKAKLGIRKNETKVFDAIRNKTVQEGDKVWMFYRSDSSLALVEDFDGDYDPIALLKLLYSTTKIFANVLDITVFPKYQNKGNRKLLDELLNNTPK